MIYPASAYVITVAPQLFVVRRIDSFEIAEASINCGVVIPHRSDFRKLTRSINI